MGRKTQLKEKEDLVSGMWNRKKEAMVELRCGSIVSSEIDSGLKTNKFHDFTPWN